MVNSLIVTAALACLYGAEVAAASLLQQILVDDNDWQQYIKGPPNKIVFPKSVVQSSVSGNISNPSALIDRASSTVLSRLDGQDSTPSLVIDFGQVYAGYLNLELQGSTSSTTSLPGLRLAFSETLQFLTDKSDFTRSDNADSGDVRCSKRTMSTMNTC
jgi:hypothetical protein